MRKKQLESRGDGFVENLHYRQNWKRITSLLAVFVVIGTVSSLMLPAITMSDVVCGLEEHLHSENCYETALVPSLSCDRDTLAIHSHSTDCLDTEGSTVCGQVDFVVHTHDGRCWNTDGSLACSLKEIEEHRHDENCYQIPEIITDEGHTHSDDCYEWVTSEAPTCGIQETPAHQHNEACFAVETTLICMEPEIAGHIHGDTCYTLTDSLTCGSEEFEGHSHGDGCYSEDDTPVCELEEIVGHTHDPGCYTQTKELICEEPEIDGHSHDQNCYIEAGTLVCTMEETPGHQHTDECYSLVKGELLCTEEEREPVIEFGDPVLVCEEPEVILHIHDENCYEYDDQGNPISLICGKPEIVEHQHTDACFTETEVTNLVCQLPEHTHTEECSGFAALSEEEQAQVDALILVIDTLPSHEEVTAQLAAYDEAGDTAGRDAYTAALAEQLSPIFDQYHAMTDGQQSAVINAAKLIALEWLLPEDPTEPTETTEPTEAETLPDPETEEDSFGVTVSLGEDLTLPEGTELRVQEYAPASEEWLAYYARITEEAGWTVREPTEEEPAEPEVPEEPTEPEEPAAPEEPPQPPAEPEAPENPETPEIPDEPAPEAPPLPEEETAQEPAPQNLRLFHIGAFAGEEPFPLPDPVSVTLSYSLAGETPCQVLDASGAGLPAQTTFADGIQSTTFTATLPGTIGLLLGPDWQLTEPDPQPLTPQPPVTLTYPGADYSVTVTYGPEAGLPEGTELAVTEYPEDSEIPLQRYTQASALYGWAEGEFHPFRLFSIALMAEGVAVQPEAPVEVSIALTGMEGLTQYQVTHYGDETAETLESVSDFAEGTQTIRFTTAGFSDFSLSAVEGTQVTPLANVSTDIDPVNGYTAAKGTYNTWKSLSNNFLDSCQKLEFYGDAAHRDVPDGQKIQVGDHYTDTALSGDQTVYPFVIPVSDAILEKGGTVKDCGSIIFTNTGTVGGKAVDTVVTFNQVKFSGNFKTEYLAQYKNAPVGAKNGKVCIAAVKHTNELWIGMNYCTDVAAKERYGDSYYTYPCVLTSDVTITIRDHETKQPVSTQFLQTASDIDVWRGGGTWTYPGHEKAVTEPYRGRYAETFTTVSCFSNTFYCYPESRNKITERAAGQVSVAATIHTMTNDGKLTDTGTTYINGVSGQNSWKKAGVYGETLGSTWKMQYIDQWCSTEVEIYVPQWPVTVKKVDSENATQTLAGAKFILSRTENNAPVYYTASGWVNDQAQADRLTTAADGMVTVPGLNPGDYTLTEVEAPPGYQLRGSNISFNLSIGGTVTCKDPMVTVANNNSLLLQVQNKAGQRLPDTGGAGTDLYTFSGWAMITVACALMYNLKRSKRKGAR